MKVKLTRRWGSNKPGSTVDVNPAMGDWLTATGYGETSKGAATTGAVAAGSDGPDLRAGGDPSRRSPRSITSAGRSDTTDLGQPARRPANPAKAPSTTGTATTDTGDTDTGTGSATTTRRTRGS